MLNVGEMELIMLRPPEGVRVVVLHCSEFKWYLDLEFDKVKSILEGPSGDRPPQFGSISGLVASPY